MSAIGNRVDEEDLKTARIDAFLSKPLRQAQLLESLRP